MLSVSTLVGYVPAVSMRCPKRRREREEAKLLAETTLPAPRKVRNLTIRMWKLSLKCQDLNGLFGVSCTVRHDICTDTTANSAGPCTEQTSKYPDLHGRRDRQTDKQTERERERRTDRPTDRPTERQTETRTQRYIIIVIYIYINLLFIMYQYL